MGFAWISDDQDTPRLVSRTYAPSFVSSLPFVRKTIPRSAAISDMLTYMRATVRMIITTIAAAFPWRTMLPCIYVYVTTDIHIICVYTQQGTLVLMKRPGKFLNIPRR